MDRITTKQGTSVGRAPNQNVLKHKPGPWRQAKQVTDSLEAFSLSYYRQYAYNNCWVYQSKYPKLSMKIWKYNCKLKQIHTLWYNWSNWNKTFIGKFYILSALKVNIHNSNQIWYHESSNDLLVATISLKRFHFLTGFIEFDDKASREERWQFDMFACIRDFFEIVNENMSQWEVHHHI